MTSLEEERMEQVFETKQVEAQPVLTIRATTSADKLPDLLGVLFGEVYEHILQSGQQPAGMPFSRYYAMDGHTLNVSCGMPVASAMEGAGRVEAGELPACTVATATHMGPYDNLPQSWNALVAWMRSQDLEPADAPWEVYVTDPGEEPDTSKWRTDIFFPVR
jgi:effector-binding domain-containing protein